jgi:hypothetical protein
MDRHANWAGLVVAALGVVFVASWKITSYREKTRFARGERKQLADLPERDGWHAFDERLYRFFATPAPRRWTLRQQLAVDLRHPAFVGALLILGLGLGAGYTQHSIVAMAPGIMMLGILGPMFMSTMRERRNARLVMVRLDRVDDPRFYRWAHAFGPGETRVIVPWLAAKSLLAAHRSIEVLAIQNLKDPKYANAIAVRV